MTIFSFINQYYKMVSENPEELHKFYKDQSDFVHPLESEQVRGIHEIK